VDDPTRLQHQERRRLSWRQWALGAAVVILVVFVALNSEQVNVNFIVGSANMPLAIALLVATLIGVLIGWLASHLPQRRKPGSEERP
jgi:uncharacterized integral membrane protein